MCCKKVASIRFHSLVLAGSHSHVDYLIKYAYLCHYASIAATQQLNFVLGSWHDPIFNVGQKGPDESSHRPGQVHYCLLFVILGFFECFFSKVVQNVSLAGLATSIDIYKRPFVIATGRRIGVVSLSCDVLVEQVLA